MSVKSVNMDLCDFDQRLSKFMSPTAHGHNNHRRLKEGNEKSLDAEDLNLAFSVTFPNKEQIKSDEFWRRTFNSEIERPPNAWRAQPETITLPSTSTQVPDEGVSLRTRFGEEEIWSNVFFPTSAPNVSSLLMHSSSKKTPQSELMTVSPLTHSDNCLPRSSSLFRQKIVENLNNGEAATPRNSASIDEDFFKVFFLFLISFCQCHDVIMLDFQCVTFDSSNFRQSLG